MFMFKEENIWKNEYLNLKDIWIKFIAKDVVHYTQYTAHDKS